MMESQSVESLKTIGINATSGDLFSRSHNPGGRTKDFFSKIDGLDYTIDGEMQCFAGCFSDGGSQLTGERTKLGVDIWSPLVRIILEKYI